ncbi:HIT family hydrolase (plasmid) [Legionella adelaidensis]|uniref:HIT family hydrolase n=1 Tax=Legionella adelaidensis TaxID=45056 RepID=A0A0W0R0H2_9GAMM|nr:histidine triad nucleotide-binding protein [Legionella adelaidensis]KTC64546.1 HIT family hydrolase [Legionella adelaidensis]VEH85913.1 HIT family hydrolase [Legionella adelaidensis]
MDCLFCKIGNGGIPATIVFEDSEIVAFRDIKPQAPKHILVVPKKHITTINETDTTDELLLGRMILVAKKIALQEGLEKGYRLVFNVESQGGQEVPHIHLHILGGRQMTWPPG